MPWSGDAHAVAARLAERDGRPNDAEIIVADALKLLPENPWLQNEMGKFLARKGQNEKAIPFLRNASAVLGNAAGSFWTYTTTLAMLGAYEELVGLQDRMDELSGPGLHPYGYYRHLALAKLALKYDRNRCLDEIRAAQRSSRWLDGRRLLGRIEEAVTTRQPFSFIRMGDGEARLLCFLDPKVRAWLREPELLAMINSVWVNWFGQDVQEFRIEDVAELNQLMGYAVKVSDVVGLPAEESIVHDHYHFGFFTEMQDAILRDSSGHLTPAMVHTELQRLQPFLGDILRGQQFLGFVGCHEQLAPELGRHHSIAATRTYRIPGENGRPQLPAELRVRGHFPGIFHEIMQTLEVPFRGAVFLVAAGVCGKVYCARIKELGGIAIDIGSLADCWLGFNTRPGQYDDVARWKLPNA
jgi:hypothetical protein